MLENWTLPQLPAEYIDFIFRQDSNAPSYKTVRRLLDFFNSRLDVVGLMINGHYPILGFVWFSFPLRWSVKDTVYVRSPSPGSVQLRNRITGSIREMNDDDTVKITWEWFHCRIEVRPEVIILLLKRFHRNLTSLLIFRNKPSLCTLICTIYRQTNFSGHTLLRPVYIHTRSGY